MKYGILVIAVLFAGCTTIQEESLQYCDTSRTKFIGITLSTQQSCKGVSASDSQGDIPLPAPQ